MSDDIKSYGPGETIDCLESCEVPDALRLLQTSPEPMGFSRRCPNEDCSLYVRWTQ